MIALLLFVGGILLDVPPVVTECICSKAKVHDGWCDPCKIGYVAGLKISSKLLFTTIDHGHEIPSDTRCETCKKAIPVDEFCNACQVGYYQRKIYYSSFTHCLVKGVRVNREQVSCAACLRNMEEGGWCDVCKRGIFGNVSVMQQAHFDQAVASFRRLKLGLAHLDQCELCGIAMYSNGMCPKCEIIYKNGKPTTE